MDGTNDEVPIEKITEELMGDPKELTEVLRDALQMQRRMSPLFFTELISPLLHTRSTGSEYPEYLFILELLTAYSERAQAEQFRELADEQDVKGVTKEKATRIHQIMDPSSG